MTPAIGSRHGFGYGNPIVPIRDSVSRTYSEAFPEDATILAPPVLGSPTILRSSQPAVTAACMHAAVSSELTNRVNLR